MRRTLPWLAVVLAACSSGSSTTSPPTVDAALDASLRHEGGSKPPRADGSVRKDAPQRPETGPTLDAGHDAPRAPDGGHDAERDAGHDATPDAARDAHHDATPDAAPTPANLRGAIQKGPFVLGSSVQLAAIDTSGSPTGSVFNTLTTDDLGDFSVSLTYRGGLDLVTSGFYYDEVTGTLSSSDLSLRALYDVSSGGPQTGYINIVTHLAHDRALSRMASGSSLEAAEAQAESELVAALGLGGAGFNLGSTGVHLNEVGANNAANAYLFAVSATLVETVILQTGTTSLDANLQELLDTVASDLVSNGTLPAPVTTEVLAAEQALDVDLTADLFAARLTAIGSAASAADLDVVIDSDGDGSPNSVDTCPLVANAMQTSVPTGVLCAVTRHTSFLPSTTHALVATPLVADFESTGFPGVLMGESTGWSLGLGDGTGRFAAPAAVTLPAGFVPTVAIDLNMDGHVDLVGPIGWVAGDGAGHFDGLSSFNAGAFTKGLVVGDFNHDGLLDVAGLGYVGLSVQLATHAGVFGTAVVSGSPLSDGTVWLSAFDVNDDGNLDLVGVGSAGSAVVLFGSGSGSFTAGPTTSLGYGLNGAAVADFDGDGLVDVAGWNGSNVVVGYGDGAGAFGSLATTPVSSTQVAVGDFNADGLADLWLGYDAGCDASVSVMLSSGRVFGAPQLLRATPATCGSSAVLVAQDLNGDGTPDAVLVSQGGSGFAWSLQGYVVGAMPDHACASATCGGVCTDTSSNWFNCGRCGDTCALGAACVAGACACPGNDAVCGDECVDKTRNVDNCGTCGHVCTATGQSCVSGSCACPGSEAVCSGACVDKSDDSANCGSCGHACTATGQSCVGGSCACPAGQEVCSGACVDKSDDSANCGSCGHACTATGQSCVGGSCACPGSETVCRGACVATTTLENCGTCGNACTATGQSCVGGSCACSGTDTLCGETCVNTDRNDQNCGSCGNPCSVTGQFCAGGSCVCPTGEIACDGACVKDDTLKNCGTCGNTCTTTFGTGSMCQAGICACPAGLTVCGGACVDTATDGNNCTACGNECATSFEPGSVCEAGTCTCGSLTDCNGSCIDTHGLDVNNCGRCGNVCPTGGECAYGICRCINDSEVQCGSVCSEPMADSYNCGSCGHVCPAPTTYCSGGSCYCPDGLIFCDVEGICSALNTNTDCGKCGVECDVDYAPGSQCVNAKCACVAPLSFCDYRCRDFTSDPDNCGACGHSCAASDAGTTCTNGLCTP